MVEKKIVHTVHLTTTEFYYPGVMRPLYSDEKEEIKGKLQLLDKKDDEKKALGKAKSDLESSIYSIREKMESTNNVNKVSTEEEREVFLFFIIRK